MSRPRVLVIDDELGIQNLLSRVLGAEGFEVQTAGDGEKGLKTFKESHPDLVLLDMRMPKKDGISVLRGVMKSPSACPVIMMTAHSTVANAVEAMKIGASDYICKPFDVDDLVMNVRKNLEVAELRSEVESLRHQVTEAYHLDGIIGTDPQMIEIFDMIRRVARTRSTVFITGESGTGKELIARAIHQSSPRSKRRFVKVNCAALSDTLLESELFGHLKGAFTGATQDRIGRFQLADQGTLLLDEIGEMPMRLQAKLLRVLQEKEFEPVGASEPVQVDVRILATTNKDLSAEIVVGRFREDLYFRLNVVAIQFPPLRERPGDIPSLALHFLNRFVEETNKRVEGISAEAMDLLTAYPWPGNVRELQNAIERAVVLCRENLLRVEDFPPDLLRKPDPAGGDSYPAGMRLRDMERDLVLRTLGESGGNRNRAADMLGISVRTLRNKIKEYREAGLIEESL